MNFRLTARNAINISEHAHIDDLIERDIVGDAAADGLDACLVHRTTWVRSTLEKEGSPRAKFFTYC